MPLFTYSFRVDAPRAAVSHFHHDTSALKRLTPPPVIVQLHNVEPLAEGSLSEFTLWFGPIPVQWRAVHSNVGPEGFTDTLEHGLLREWVHTHRFIAAGENTTIVEERVEYAHARGIKGLLSRLLFPRPLLWLLFSYRRLVTQKALNKSRR